MGIIKALAVGSIAVGAARLAMGKKKFNNAAKQVKGKAVKAARSVAEATAPAKRKVSAAARRRKTRTA